MIEDRLAGWLSQGLAGAAPALGLSDDLPTPELLAPKQKDHGDFATNVALGLAARAGKPPREVAQAIIDALSPASFVERVEIAGPGFINVFVTHDWLHEALRDVVKDGASYGRGPRNGISVQVEFVSANPTGPLHVGHARNAALGDAIARSLDAAGWDVHREYYFNDAGGQMDRFGASVVARYLQLAGVDADVPDDGYHGEYIAELARDIFETHGEAFVDLPPDERLARLRAEGAERVLGWIRRTLDRFGVGFDDYVSEATLDEKGAIAEAIERLRAAGYAYESEGALWFRSTAFGDDKDRPLIRSNGTHTYFGADCAYLVDKFSRGFDRLIYVWGADHHGDVARVRGAAQALGHDPAALEMVIYQWVAFLRDGEALPMSKRAGTFVTLDELLDEVGVDAARFTLLQSSNDSAMNFDIEAVKQQTMENPVYYVQYGHARIASILRKANDQGIAMKPIADVDLSVLTHDAETSLLRALAEVPAEIARAAELRSPHRLTHAVQDLAARFHRFYAERRVVSEDEAQTQARLWLSVGTKQAIANLLGLLGVSAPERMDRDDG